MIRTTSRPVLLALLGLQALMLVFPVALWLDGSAIAQEGQQQPQQPPPQQQPPGEGGLDVDIDINKSPETVVWYGQWWVWAIGVGVFLILVIALTRGRSSV